MENKKFLEKNELNKIIVTVTIELALLKIGNECLENVTETLKTDYNCSISDCYENPEYLDRILKDHYGKASKVVINYINNALREFAQVEEISNFLKVVCK